MSKVYVSIIIVNYKLKEQIFSCIESIYKNTKNKNAGIVSPLLTDEKGQIPNLQGYKSLNPINSIFTYSIFRKFFQNYSIYKNYSKSDWQKNSVKEVEAVPGAALMISKQLFDR